MANADVDKRRFILFLNLAYFLQVILEGFVLSLSVSLSLCLCFFSLNSVHVEVAKENKNKEDA